MTGFVTSVTREGPRPLPSNHDCRPSVPGLVGFPTHLLQRLRRPPPQRVGRSRDCVFDFFHLCVEVRCPHSLILLLRMLPKRKNIFFFRLRSLLYLPEEPITGPSRYPLAWRMLSFSSYVIRIRQPHQPQRYLPSRPWRYGSPVTRFPRCFSTRIAATLPLGDLLH